MAVLIATITSTELFTGDPTEPLQVVRVILVQDDRTPDGSEASVRIEGPGVRTPRPARALIEPGVREVTVEVSVTVSTALPVGSVVPVVASVDGGDTVVRRPGELVVAEPGWTMILMSHFHYDPVWWNTQANYTERWEGYAHPRLPFQASAFDLLDRHLERAIADADYTFVVAELDYLKPYWDSRPGQRAAIRSLLAQGRLEVVGGTYNEPSSNLSGTEATARNAVYGSGFQHDVLGADPRTAWQLDVFGHDPQFPALMAAAGLTSTAWARGPFHQNGPTSDYLGAYPRFFSKHEPFHNPLATRDPARMQFPSEFEWVSPSGPGLLTGYLHNHYLSGWDLDAAHSLGDAEESAYQLFLLMKRATSTRNVLLPVGTDFSIPSRWVTAIHRDWNRRYVWPRFRTGLPRDYFAAVRAELAESGRVATPQTRDMNPIWTGKDVSLIDTKQAQRALENLVVDAEKHATLAALHGVPYPEAELDLAWRTVLFGSHHDAVTGTGSDQVYVDLLGAWREGCDIAAAVRDRSLSALADLVDTRGIDQAIIVRNSQSWQRSDLVHATVDLPPAGTGPGDGLRLTGPGGDDVEFVVEGDTPTAAGRRVELVFVAREVPALGHHTYRLLPAPDPVPVWVGDPAAEHASAVVAENESYRVELDPARGGAVSHLVHRASGRELIQAGRVGNELVVYDEYPDHPNIGEGPWMLVPTGRSTGSAAAPATEVRRERSPAGTAIVVRTVVDGITFEQRLTLWAGLDRIELRTRVEDHHGTDKLIRVRWPLAVAGGRPVAEVGDAVIGRAFGFPDVDSATSPWTLDTPCNRWCAVGSTARVVVRGAAVGGSSVGQTTGSTAQAVGVAEVIVRDPTDPAGSTRELVVALARAGVTATTSRAAGPRYGNLDVDSNLPDVRISVGHPARNTFTAQVLADADPAYAAEVERQLSSQGHARVWIPARLPNRVVHVPMADLRDARALPVLVLADRAPGAAAPALPQPAAVQVLVEDLADATIELTQPAELARLEEVDAVTAGLLNRGTPGFVVDTTGALHVSLMRSCSGWPSGVWIDEPRRTAPDGSAFHLQHWTHDFQQAFAAGAGDWRTAGLVRQGQSFNHPLVATQTTAHDGPLEPSTSLGTLEPADGVILTALKPAGNPIASGGLRRDGDRNVTARLYQVDGRPTAARLRLLDGFDSARRTDLLERPVVTELAVDDGSVAVRLEGAEIATLSGELSGPHPIRVQRDDGGADDYGRPWRHNRGPGSAGWAPVSVHVAEQIVAAPRAGGPRSVEVTIASDRPTAMSTGRLTVHPPAGWVAEPAMTTYSVPPGAFISIPVGIRPPPDAPDGSYPVLAAISDDIGGRRSHDAFRYLIGDGTVGTGLEIAVEPSRVRLTRGGSGELTVVLTSTTPADVRADLHLLAPFAAWGAVPRPRVQAVVPAGQTTRVRVPLTGGVAPGNYWVLPKLMWLGRVLYAPSVSLVVTG